MLRHYTVSDGKLVLAVKESRDGGYVVSSPLDPELFTEGETLDEAVENAHEVASLLAAHRRDMAKTVFKQRGSRDRYLFIVRIASESSMLSPELLQN